MINKSKNPRYLALKTLMRVQNGAYSNLQLDNAIKQSDMNVKDVALFTNLVYGVIQHQFTLDFYVNAFLKRPDKVQDWVKLLLSLSVYQMKYLDKIPNRAIFNEAIAITKMIGNDGQRRLVTGVLHGMQRKGFPGFDQISNPIDRLSAEFSVPTWIIKELEKQTSVAKTKSILKSLNQQPKQSIRVNSAKTNLADLSDLLKKEGYEVKPSKVSPAGLILTGKPASASQWFKEGYFTIQDESAMLPVEALEVKEDDAVLDACAAPGGKTTQIAEKLTSGRVEALDLHEKKLNLIKRNAKRLGVSDRVNTNALDARRVGELFPDETFDKILVDAPCTGFGLMRRKPEIRYQKTKRDVTQLQKVQSEILDAVSKKVKVGGKIIFSTCTILDEENSENVKTFLDNHPDFKPVKIKTGKNLKFDRNYDYLKIYPDDFNSDGFFISGFQRVK